MTKLGKALIRAAKEARVMARRGIPQVVKAPQTDIDALIERLRELAPTLQCTHAVTVSQAADALAKLQEINVTQADRKDAEIARLNERIAKQGNEITILRERLGCPPADQERNHLAEQCKTLVGENTKLREALQDILIVSGNRNMRDIARSALGERS